MPTNVDEAVLQQLNDHELLWLMMRELYRIYDHAGISSRCERSLVLEAGLMVCGKTGEMPPDIQQVMYTEAASEVVRRTNPIRQHGLWSELGLLSTDDFLALVIQRVQSLYLALPERGSVEGSWIDLLVRFTRPDCRGLPSPTSQEIISEGRERGFFTVENMKGIWPAA